MNRDHHLQLPRRDFATLSGASAIALLAKPSVAADAEKSSGWIDAHVHVWHPDIVTYPLSPRFTQSDMQPPSFTDDELFRHCRPAGVDRIVLIQMSFYESDHRYINEVMVAHPGVFSGVALIDYHATDLVSKMKQLAHQGMRGLRLHSHGDAKDWVADPAMLTLWRRAPEENLAVCPLINPADISHVDALCKKFPDTTVVVDHFARIGISGQIDPTELAALCGLARFPRVHVKTSAFYALGRKKPPYDDLAPMIRQVLDAYGPERLMWASDCPFQVQGEHSYQASIGLIRDRLEFLSAGDKQSMLRGTAERVFFS